MDRDNRDNLLWTHSMNTCIPSIVNWSILYAFLDLGPWTLDLGPWTLDPGPSTLDIGHWTLDSPAIRTSSICMKKIPNINNRGIVTSHSAIENPYWYNSDLAADQNDFWLDTKVVVLIVNKPYYIGKIHLSLYFAANRNLLSFTIESCLEDVR